MGIRLNFVVEGQTERAFVNRVLGPHLADLSIWVSARCVETKRSRTRKFSGGISSYVQAKKDIENWMKQDQSSDALFTTMFDFYALPTDFPGSEQLKGQTDPYERVNTVENALAKDIADQRLIPYIQLHEFEALLLAEPSKLSIEFLENANGIKALVDLVSYYESPELIDEGISTAPSKRIIAEIPEYAARKQSAGPNITSKIGLPNLRSKCKHFSEWIDTLELLSDK